MVQNNTGSRPLSFTSLGEKILGLNRKKNKIGSQHVSRTSETGCGNLYTVKCEVSLDLEL